MGRVREAGPEETPPGAGEDRESAQVQEEDQASYRRAGQGHDEGQTSPQPKIDPDTARKTGQGRDVGQTSPQPKIGPGTETARVHGRDRTRRRREQG